MLPDIRWCVVLYRTLGNWVVQCALKVREKFVQKLNAATTNIPWDTIAWTGGVLFETMHSPRDNIAWTMGVSCATTDSPWDMTAWTGGTLCDCTVLETWLSLSGGVPTWLVICLERGADLHMAQLMPLPLTVSCFSQIQIGFTFLVPAHPGSPGIRAVTCI